VCSMHLCVYVCDCLRVLSNACQLELCQYKTCACVRVCVCMCSCVCACAYKFYFQSVSSYYINWCVSCVQVCVSIHACVRAHVYFIFRECVPATKHRRVHSFWGDLIFIDVRVSVQTGVFRSLGYVWLWFGFSFIHARTYTRLHVHAYTLTHTPLLCILCAYAVS
jgi:hypothetical protein